MPKGLLASYTVTSPTAGRKTVFRSPTVTALAAAPRDTGDAVTAASGKPKKVIAGISMEGLEEHVNVCTALRVRTRPNMGTSSILAEELVDHDKRPAPVTDTDTFVPTVQRWEPPESVDVAVTDTVTGMPILERNSRKGCD